MNMLPCKKEFAWNKNHSYGNPYAIAFVYPKVGNPFIIKGGKTECVGEVYNLPGSAFIMLTEWKGKIVSKKSYKYTLGRGRHVAAVTIKSIYSKHKMIWTDHLGNTQIKTVRRIPRKWIHEFEFNVTQEDACEGSRWKHLQLLARSRRYAELRRGEQNPTITISDSSTDDINPGTSRLREADSIRVTSNWQPF